MRHFGNNNNGLVILKIMGCLFLCITGWPGFIVGIILIIYLIKNN